MRDASSELEFIKKTLPKDKVYAMWLSRLDAIEKSTISSDFKDRDRVVENSMDIGFRLFPLINSISLNLFGEKNGRKYLKELGCSSKESNIIISMFRNGILHTGDPYQFEYEDGVVTWGLMSSSGSSGFTPHFPGYFDEKDPQFNVPADKFFDYVELSPGKFHASLQLDRLLANVKYDLTERQKKDMREFIDFVDGQKIEGKVPKV